MLTPQAVKNLGHNYYTGKMDNKANLRLHNGIANITEQWHSEIEISLLKKGLSFMPTTLKIYSIEHKISLKKLKTDIKIGSTYPLDPKDSLTVSLKL